MILISSIVNRQRTSLAVYAVGLILEVGMVILAIKLGYGIAGVAVSAIAAQCVVTIMIFMAAHKYMAVHTRKVLNSYWLIVLPFVVAISFYFYHDLLASHFSTPQYTALSIVTQIIVWGLTIAVFYRRYISVAQARSFLAKVLWRT